MSERGRVDLAALRHDVEIDAFVRDTETPCKLDAREYGEGLLALVEAVEAAHALVEADRAEDAALHALFNAEGATDELFDAQAATARGVTDAFARLEEALTRFDFGRGGSS